MKRLIFIAPVLGIILCLIWLGIDDGEKANTTPNPVSDRGSKTSQQVVNLKVSSSGLGGISNIVRVEQWDPINLYEQYGLEDLMRSFPENFDRSTLIGVNLRA